MSFDLIKLDQAKQLLAECKTTEDAKKFIDIAESARHYAKVNKLGLEASNYATEVKLRATRRLGELLKQSPRATGGQPFQSSTCTTPSTSRNEPTLSELGITRNQSSQAQTIAALPDEDFEREIATTKNNCDELTSSRVLQKARRYAAGDKPPPPPLDGKYRVIYADPPWKYNDSGLDDYGHAERHYPPMAISELCDLPIKEILDKDAVLFLWVTSPLLEESFRVVRAWGFQYKSSFVWDKVNHNFGHYNSVRHEFLLICTTGSCTPDVPKLFDSVQVIQRSKTHSEKPERFREIIDTIYPHGNRIELFSRRKSDNWETWGNEATA